jgi:NAD(P)-dependent dehydrogenase (short-subunit alcohol dehydrogenase family)
MTTAAKPDLSGQVIIVTGANSGIGKVTALELAKMGTTVVMVARSRERGTEALADIKAESGNDDVHLMLCDLSSQTSIRHFAQAFRDQFDRLDVLVNNAGAYYAKRQESVDGLEMTFALNHIGYFLLTKLLLDMLKESAPARIVNVSSGAQRVGKIDWDDLQRLQGYSGFEVYGQTKLMNILFTYELARRLEGTGVTVNALHPGFVRTNFARNNYGLLGKIAMPLVQLFARSPEEGAQTSIYLASSPEVEGVTGEYFVDEEPARSAPISYDREAQQRLWEISEASLVKPADDRESAAGEIQPAVGQRSLGDGLLQPGQ